MNLTSRTNIARPVTSLGVRNSWIVHALMCSSLSDTYECIVMRYGHCLSILRLSMAGLTGPSRNKHTFGGPVVPDEKHKNAIRFLLSPGWNCIRLRDFIRFDSTAVFINSSTVGFDVSAMGSPTKIILILYGRLTSCKARSMLLAHSECVTISFGCERRI